MLAANITWLTRIPLLLMLDGWLVSLLLGMDKLLLGFWRNAELKILFCDTVHQERLQTGPAAFDSFGVCLPGVARVVVCGVELSELLPGEVRDDQRFASWHHRVGVVWVQLVLEVLGVHTLIFWLQKHKQTWIVISNSQCNSDLHESRLNCRPNFSVFSALE